MRRFLRRNVTLTIVVTIRPNEHYTTLPSQSVQNLKCSLDRKDCLGDAVKCICVFYVQIMNKCLTISRFMLTYRYIYDKLSSAVA